MSKFDQTADVQQKWAGSGVYTSTTIRDAYDVPRKRSLYAGAMNGGFTFAAVIFLAYVSWRVIGFAFPMDYIALAAVAFGGIVFFVSAKREWAGTSKEFMKVIKIAMGVDENKNMIPDVLENNSTVYVTIERNGGKFFNELPYGERLVEWARRVKAGAKMTARGRVGGLYSESEWPIMADALLLNDYAQYKNQEHTNLGIELTADGEALRDALLADAERIESETGAAQPAHVDKFQWTKLPRSPSGGKR